MLDKMHTLFLFLSLTFLHTVYANENNATANHLAQKPTFTSTYWKLINLSEHDMLPDEMSREAHLIFFPITDGKGTFKGATGCNDMLGKYAGNENNISIDIKHMAMTRLACPDMQTETQFIKILGHTISWKIHETRLEFIDSNGTSIAMFEALTGRSL